MIKAVLSGCNGAMGRTITEAVGDFENIQIVCGFDKVKNNAPYPIVTDFSDLKEKADVVIDFSHPSVLEAELKFCLSQNIPVVLASTGYSTQQIEMINEASKSIPIFYTANMSLGVNLMDALCRQAAKVLSPQFDIEIIEAHHNQKVDAPSGTALLLADGINEALQEPFNFEFDRHSKRKRREKNEIGISSIRGGTIVGEHTVLFAGNNECIEIKHTAFAKTVFANGALNAAMWLINQPAGLYDMKNFLKNL